MASTALVSYLESFTYWTCCRDLLPRTLNPLEDSFWICFYSVEFLYKMVSLSRSPPPRFHSSISATEQARRRISALALAGERATAAAAARNHTKQGGREECPPSTEARWEQTPLAEPLARSGEEGGTARVAAYFCTAAATSARIDRSFVEYSELC